MPASTSSAMMMMRILRFMAGVVGMQEQAVTDEIEHFPFAYFQAGPVIRVGLAEEMKHLGCGEIEHNERDEGDRGMTAVGAAEFALAHAAFEHAVQGLAARQKIFAHQ